MSQNSISNKSQTDWDKLEDMSSDEIDFSDVDEIMPELFAQACAGSGHRAKGYQTKINDLLRADMNAHGQR